MLQAPTLAGHLIDAAGAPVAGATITAITDYAFDFSTTTDADGRYDFGKVPTATVKISFRTVDGRTQWAHQKLTFDEANEFTLTVGAATVVDDQLLN